MALGDRVRRVRARGRAVAAALAVAAVTAVVLWVSDLAPGWLAPALSGGPRTCRLAAARRRHLRS